MADYSFGGTDEENAELKKLNTEVVCLMLRTSPARLMIAHFMTKGQRLRTEIARGSGQF